MNALEIKGVSKTYGSLQALDQIDLSVRAGEFFGLLGPNGAGKSTLISALAGLIKTDQGSISVMGADVQQQFRLARSNIGVVPQEVVIDPFFTVREILRFQSGYFGLRQNDAWIDELLVKLRLSDKSEVNLRKLSGGMKRRVLIAQALVHKPLVLVLDEPTAGVDVELRESLWGFVRELHAQGTTIVLTTHYLEEAEALCDRIAIIDKGKVIALETKADLLARGLGMKLVVLSKGTFSDLPSELKAKVLFQSESEVHFAYHREADSMMTILDTLRASGTDIDYVSVEGDSLQDVFLQLTGSSTNAVSAS